MRVPSPVCSRYIPFLSSKYPILLVTLVTAGPSTNDVYISWDLPGWYWWYSLVWCRADDAGLLDVDSVTATLLSEWVMVPPLLVWLMKLVSAEYRCL